MVLANLLRGLPKALQFAKKIILKTNFSHKIWPGIPVNNFVKYLTISDPSSFYRNSCVKRTSNILNSPISIRKYNYLIQAYGNFNSILRYRYQLPQKSLLFNRMRRCIAFPKKMCMSFLKPNKFLSNGCFGAVWSAKCLQLEDSTKEREDSPAQYESNDLAVKVLYNFYASNPVSGDLESYSGSISSMPDNWYLFDKQIERECHFRPSTDHPNIVPILKTFFDLAPPNNEQSKMSESSNSEIVPWENAENFPEGFGGRPLTCYLVMPRFDATLEDLSSGKWRPSSFSYSLARLTSDSEVRPLQTEPAVRANPAFLLPTEDAVALLAQLFEAVAELEISKISHRDLKPSNILIRNRESKTFPKMAFMNSSEAELANSHLHAAITDFGCATRTGGQLANYPSHSGNIALWPPEVALYFKNQQEGNGLPILPLDYSRADIWSVATHTYLLFSGENPFLSGLLSSVDYDDQNLPSLPPTAPGILDWVLQTCLSRDPNKRPPASLVADVLHVWCILKHWGRRVSTNLNREVEHFLEMNAIENLKTSNCQYSSPLIEQEFNWTKQSRHRRDHIHKFLQLAWAYDWLLGPAQALGGLRCKFYARITPERFSACLRLLNRVFVAKISVDFRLLMPDPLANLDCMI